MRLIVEDEIETLEGATFRVKVEPAPERADKSVWVTVHRTPAPWPVLSERWADEAAATTRAERLKETLRSGEQQLSYRPALRRSRVQTGTPG